MAHRSRPPSGPSGRPEQTPDPRFVSAVQLHQQGRLDEAEALYRGLLLANPRDAASLHYLGVVALQRGKNAEAAELVGRSLRLRKGNAEAHYHLGLAFAGLGRLDETVTHNKRAIALQPDHPQAYMNLGNALKALGRLVEAEKAYERTLALSPGLPEAHFNLANLLLSRGEVDAAITRFEHALAARPHYPEALNNLATALFLRGRLTEAVARFADALRLRPDFVEALVGQALALLSQHDAAGALTLACRALMLRPSDEAKDVLVSAAQMLREPPDIPQLPDLLVRALQDPWTRPRHLSPFAAAVVRARHAQLAAAHAKAEPSESQLAPDELARLAADPLLAALLRTTPIADLPLERILTAARRSLLALPQGAAEHLLPFACALARQCFINEYIYEVREDEQAEAQRRRAALEAACHENQPIAAVEVAIAASYAPLHGMSAAARLHARDWPAALRDVVAQQVAEPAQEAVLRDTIPRLTPIADDVSRAVRRQYEENPYPRWASAPQGRAVPLNVYLRQRLPMAQFRPSEKGAAVDILVAGCGTGEHHVGLAQLIEHRRMLAVDLSLASLAFAKRQSDARALAVEYGQADILALPTLGRRFDLIVVTGVLHHMADPFAAWRILLTLLRPGGFMNVGLYSATARTDLAEAQALVAAERCSADLTGIRKARRVLSGLPADSSAARAVISAMDFYSASECRDLLLHVQEHRHTLQEIKTFVAETRLAFLGFQVSQDVFARYAAHCPADRTMSDLDGWTAFEQQNPRTFAAMYQLWVQKPA